MKYPTHPTIRPKRHTASAVLVGLVMFAIQAAYTPPAAHAGDPPDDCWGGALSADPLHCYGPGPGPQRRGDRRGGGV